MGSLSADEKQQQQKKIASAKKKCLKNVAPVLVY